jgi:hypothetical protein
MTQSTICDSLLAHLYLRYYWWNKEASPIVFNISKIYPHYSDEDMSWTNSDDPIKKLDFG